MATAFLNSYKSLDLPAPASDIIEKASIFPREDISKWKYEDKWSDLDEDFYGGSYDDFRYDDADSLIYSAIEILADDYDLCISKERANEIADKVVSIIKQELLKTF